MRLIFLKLERALYGNVNLLKDASVSPCTGFTKTSWNKLNPGLTI
jgi:hypothetical protein